MGNCPVIWSVNLYHIGSGSPVHGFVLEEFQEGHGDTDEDEHSVSSVDGQTVKEDYPSSWRTCCEHASWTSRVAGMSTFP